MEINGYVLNNTGKSKHIFKRTVFPGQRISIEEIYKVLRTKVPEGEGFIQWLSKYLPEGWEISQDSTVLVIPETENRQMLYADIVPNPKEEVGEDSRPSLEYAKPSTIEKLSARDIYNLRIKDNPRRVIKGVDSIHKLRRALTLCKNDSRKEVISKIIKDRIKELMRTM